ncbi:MAG: Thiamin-phosphate pyrophosphorylase, partial [Deltaproteobacteria bacterium]|nr:Thiamin-phosphate pyrophosphorylase [Deltaproteobacteria bacterium]
MTARNSRLSIISIGLTVVALAMVLAARTGWAVTPCEDIDPQCMRNGVCQADGTCAGEVINEGQPCNTGDPCALTPQSAQCQSGHCVTTTNKPEGTACTFPGAGLCIKNTTCQSLFGFGPFCMTQNENDIVDCDALGHKCMACDPNTGQCTIPLVPGPCETGECNPATGLFQDAPNGTACNDFNVCTSDEQCQGGVCRSGTAPTPTPTVPIGPATCTGDCNNLHVVTVDNLLTMIDIGLGKTSIAACMAGDRDHNFQITVDEVITAVPNALDGCPAVPTPTQTPTSPPQAATATPTRTPTAGGPTPTRTATAGPQTSPGPGSAVSGQTTVALSAVTVIGDVVAAIANGLTIGSASSAGSSAELLMTPADPGLGGAAASCPLGGSVTSSGNIFSGYNIQFQDNCAVETVDGKVSFGGMASVGLSGLTAAVTATFSDLSGTTVFEEAAASVAGPLVGLPTQGGSCFITAIAFRLSGSLDTTMN